MVGILENRQQEDSMKNGRFTVEQMVAAVKEYEAGTPAVEICRRLGVAHNTIYRWRAKYSGLESGDAQRLKTLEEENGRLKRLVADLALENAAIKDVLAKKW
jgi:putative transposase